MIAANSKIMAGTLLRVWLDEVVIGDNIGAVASWLMYFTQARVHSTFIGSQTASPLTFDDSQRNRVRKGLHSGPLDNTLRYNLRKWLIERKRTDMGLEPYLADGSFLRAVSGAASVPTGP